MRPLQSKALRQAIVSRLRGDTNLTALVPAERVYGQRTPATLERPFTRYGTPDELPIRRGTEIRVSLHAFSKAKFEDEVADILAALQANLEDAAITLNGGLTAYMVWVGAQILPDAAEADAWHGIASWNATIG